MRYTFELADRSLLSSHIFDAIESAMSGWVFDPSDDYRIYIYLCDKGLAELISMDRNVVILFRHTILKKFNIGLDKVIHFFRKCDPKPSKPILTLDSGSIKFDGEVSLLC